MKIAKISIEYDGYDIVAQGLVMSGDVHNLYMELSNVDECDMPGPSEMEEIEEHVRAELVESIYSPELDFS